MNYSKTAILLLATCLTAPAFAQPSSLPAASETASDESAAIIVTGSRIKQDPAKSALPLQIITTNDISREGINSPEQLISYLSTNGNAWNLLLQTSMLPRMRERSACSRQWSFNSGFVEPATQRRCLPCAG